MQKLEFYLTESLRKLTNHFKGFWLSLSTLYFLLYIKRSRDFYMTIVLSWVHVDSCFIITNTLIYVIIFLKSRVAPQPSHDIWISTLQRFKHKICGPNKSSILDLYMRAIRLVESDNLYHIQTNCNDWLLMIISLIITIFLLLEVVVIRITVQPNLSR